MFLLKKKRIRYLRSIWGKQIDKYRNYDLISSYYDLLEMNGDEEFVDDKTWNDLDFNSGCHGPFHDRIKLLNLLST